MISSAETRNIFCFLRKKFYIDRVSANTTLWFSNIYIKILKFSKLLLLHHKQ